MNDWLTYVPYVQDAIGGYKFKNPDLLRQAFVRKSYGQENSCPDNEVLEFIGDKALDFVVVKLLTSRDENGYGWFDSDEEGFDSSKYYDNYNCSYDEAKLTEIKKGLVNKKNLAACIDRLGLQDILLMGKGDIKQQVQNEDSVKEDLFEAIVGAVAIDSNWDMNAIEQVVDVMLDPIAYLKKYEDESEVNYVDLIQEFSLDEYNELPLYHYEPIRYTTTWYISDAPNVISNMANEQTQFYCMLKIGDFEYIFKAYGKSKSAARQAVCKLAYEYLVAKEYIKEDSYEDIVGTPDYDKAVNQLQELAQAKMISMPEYDFVNDYDSDGNPLWLCKCIVSSEDFITEGIGSTKKEAKKEAAYEMLLSIFDPSQYGAPDDD